MTGAPKVGGPGSKLRRSAECCVVLLVLTLLLGGCGDDPPVAPDGPSPVAGLWGLEVPLDSITPLPTAEYLEYLDLRASGACTLYVRRGDGFRRIESGTWSVSGYDVTIETRIQRSLTWTLVPERLAYSSTQFTRSSDTVGVKQGLLTLSVTQVAVVPGPGRRATRWQGLAWDGSAFHSLRPDSIVKFSATGAVLDVVAVPPPDSLSEGFGPYPSAITWDGSRLLLSVVYQPTSQRLYSIRSTDYTADGSTALGPTSWMLKSIAPDPVAGPVIWGIAQGFNGDAITWLHGVDRNTGAEIAARRQIHLDPYLLSADSTGLWGYVIAATSGPADERYYLIHFDPLDGQVDLTLRLSGFPIPFSYPFFAPLSGAAILDGTLWVLDGWDHALWKGQLPAVGTR